ncbi:MAG: NADH-ubiquinone oxidoreductase-F iron-sulfur binding region domain-containing protein [Phycisphaerae bacterium]
MSDHARARRERCSVDHNPDVVLPDLVRQSGFTSLTVEGLQTVAAKHGMSVATLRGAISSFTEMHVSPDAVRVCAGTSCLLNGGLAVSKALAEGSSCHPVYCLGYCDRSPVFMTPKDEVVPDATVADAAAGPGRPHPAPPLVRCVARSPVVTERLIPGGCHGGRSPYEGLDAALGMDPASIVRCVLESGVKGRGGAAYLTGRKWQLAAAARGSIKYIVANGDEGDPGSFIDRELMERDPHAILEGMAIAARAVGASKGIIFIRHEYPVACTALHRAIVEASERGRIGPYVGFEVEVVRGQGSYVCGEETALLAAIEGQRGEVRPRPPFPVESGLFGMPTVVDNVETLANIGWLLRNGSRAYAAMGTTESRGTKALCFNRGFARPGIVEVEFGMPLREAIVDLGGGGRDGSDLEAVLIGGPMGSIVTPDRWDVPICFAAMARAGINLGHGGLVAIPKGTDWSALLRHLVAFMRDESCGKCTPCRLGSQRLHAVIAAGLPERDLPETLGILSLMRDASLCAFGRETPGPVETVLRIMGRIGASGATP